MKKIDLESFALERKSSSYLNSVLFYSKKPVFEKVAFCFAVDVPRFFYSAKKSKNRAFSIFLCQLKSYVLEIFPNILHIFRKNIDKPYSIVSKGLAAVKKYGTFWKVLARIPNIRAYFGFLKLLN